jgi:hypothetical protein
MQLDEARWPHFALALAGGAKAKFRFPVARLLRRICYPQHIATLVILHIALGRKQNSAILTAQRETLRLFANVAASKFRVTKFWRCCEAIETPHFLASLTLANAGVHFCCFEASQQTT